MFLLLKLIYLALFYQIYYHKKNPENKLLAGFFFVIL